MATLKKVVTVCDRCIPGQEKPAVTTERFTYDGVAYKIELCETHGNMFGREMSSWALLAEEESTVFTQSVKRTEYFKAERRRETELSRARIQELAEDERARKAAALRLAEIMDGDTQADPEPEDVPSLEAGFGWALLDHAKQRAAEREIPIVEVLRTAARPERTEPVPPDGENTVRARYYRGDCRIVVNPITKEVITVMRPSQSWSADPPERIAQ